MMNQEVKAEWLKRLRSGEFKQTTGWLHDDQGYCCLGVLCEVAVKAGVIPPPVLCGADEDDEFDDDDSWQYGTEARTTALPLAVQEWAGLADELGGEVTISDRAADLAYHNDKPRTFLEIADAIEAQL